jgi:hypothetical protein
MIRSNTEVTPDQEGFCRFMDVRRNATRYNKLIAKFRSGGTLATYIAFSRGTGLALGARII